jgi:hypothetical protein
MQSSSIASYTWPALCIMIYNFRYQYQRNTYRTAFTNLARIFNITPPTSTQVKNRRNLLQYLRQVLGYTDPVWSNCDLLRVSPVLWGPYVWNFIHYVALWVTTDTRQNFLDLLPVLAVLLPCRSCGSDFFHQLRQNPAPADLVVYTILLHNKVNEKLGKPLVEIKIADPSNPFQDLINQHVIHVCQSSLQAPRTQLLEYVELLRSQGLLLQDALTCKTCALRQRRGGLV